jgi:hypothetical protein
MSQRPESVTVIAWLLIVLGTFGLMGCLTAWSMRDWPVMQPLLASYRLPYAVVLGVAASSLAVHMLCAVALLMRVGWSRHVYFITALAMVGFSLWVSPWPQFTVPSVLFPAVASMFLYRGAANRWFAAQEPAAVG